MTRLIPLLIVFMVAVNMLREGNLLGFLMFAAIFVVLLRRLRPTPQKDAPADKKAGRIQQFFDQIGSQMREELERQKAAAKTQEAPSAGESGWERFMPVADEEQEPMETTRPVEGFFPAEEEFMPDTEAVAETVPAAPPPKPESDLRTAAPNLPAKSVPPPPFDLTQAMIWSEILGPPVSLRGEGQTPGGSR